MLVQFSSRSLLGSFSVRFDGVIADLGAAMKDMDSEIAASNIGANFAKAPFPLFRGFNALVIIVMAVLQLTALYS